MILKDAVWPCFAGWLRPYPASFSCPCCLASAASCPVYRHSVQQCGPTLQCNTAIQQCNRTMLHDILQHDMHSCQRVHHLAPEQWSLSEQPNFLRILKVMLSLARNRVVAWFAAPLRRTCARSAVTATLTKTAVGCTTLKKESSASPPMSTTRIPVIVFIARRTSSSIFYLLVSKRILLFVTE
jgi:hypothetical protein